MDLREIMGRIRTDRRFRMVARAVCSLIFNLVFAFYNGIFGALTGDRIFLATAVYYLLLGLMRFAAVLLNRKKSLPYALRAGRSIGLLLMLLSLSYPAVIWLSIRHQSAAVYGEIPMIAIAAYTFAKITTAAVTAAKHRHLRAPLVKALNAVRYAEVAVSLLTMQQSMLVSFGEMDAGTAVVFNGCTGAGVCLFIFTLGFFTWKGNRK